jgi:SAM-dependent methyltransferase
VAREPGIIRVVNLNDFIQHLRDSPGARVLELGTRRVEGRPPTHRMAWAPQCSWVRVDYQAGPDVDIVADAHNLLETFSASSFDAVLACSVFEHIQRPWVAARSIAQVLKPGGRAFVQTHQSFPLHAHPHDYWRFSTEGLRTLFEDAGLEVENAYYEYPCHIVGLWPLRHLRVGLHKAYLNVSIIARRGL